jgi:hypothetical protein
MLEYLVDELAGRRVIGRVLAEGIGLWYVSKCALQNLTVNSYNKDAMRLIKKCLEIN